MRVFVSILLALSLIYPVPLAHAQTSTSQEEGDEAMRVSEDALPLSEALSAADARSEVVNARLDRDDAEVASVRTEADPLALRLERTQAAQRLELSEAQLRQARYGAYADIAAAYTRMLEAQVGLEFARIADDVRAQLVDITRIRFERGSATALDVQDAENELQRARADLDAAEQGLALAQANLESLIGQAVPAAAPVPDELLAPLPSLDTVLLGLETLPSLLQVGQGAELAEIGLDLLDPSYAAPAQIDEAELQLEQAQTSAREARRGVEIQARSLYNSAVSARQSYRNSLDALASAQAREALERQRLGAGLIADITFKQTQLNSFQAFVAMTQAKDAYLNALFALQAGTMTALEGLHDF